MHATHPDVVLMDVRMSALNGIEATLRITADPACAGTRVVMLTTFGLDEYVFGALRAGATGFLLRDTPPDELLRAVRIAAAGDALFARETRLIEQRLHGPHLMIQDKRHVSVLAALDDRLFAHAA